MHYTLYKRIMSKRVTLKGIAMKERSVNEGRLQPVDSHRRPPQKKRKARPFAPAYLIILAVLMVISACTLIYVHSALEDYEASQPENILSAQIDRLRKLEGGVQFEDILSLDKMRSEWSASEEEITQFKKDFLASSITFQEDHSVVDPTKKTFDVLSDGIKIATATLNHESQETRLLIFTLDRWSVEKMEVTGYEFHLTAPASVIVKSNGEVLQGTITDGTATYDVRSLTPLNVEICDILGNSVPYDQKNLPTFTDYKVTIPANYTIWGEEPVSIEAASLEPIEELKYVKEYCPDVPDSATYILSLLSGEPDFKILDGSGNEVNFTIEDRKVIIDENFAGQDSLSLPVDIDPLAVAKLWSLLMTQDLTGANNGYGQISPYLIKGSYLQEVAWKWAIGQDITFTSAHTLKNPPFQVEEISNYVVYSDNCFSCDIRLEKTLVLTRTGEEVKDVMNSTFYFVKYDDTDNGADDPHWVLADYHEIL